MSSPVVHPCCPVCPRPWAAFWFAFIPDTKTHLSNFHLWPAEGSPETLGWSCGPMCFWTSEHLCVRCRERGEVLHHPGPLSAPAHPNTHSPPARYLKELSSALERENRGDGRNQRQCSSRRSIAWLQPLYAPMAPLSNSLSVLFTLLFFSFLWYFTFLTRPYVFGIFFESAINRELSCCSNVHIHQSSIYTVYTVIADTVCIMWIARQPAVPWLKQGFS